MQPGALASLLFNACVCAHALKLICIFLAAPKLGTRAESAETTLTKNVLALYLQQKRKPSQEIPVGTISPQVMSLSLSLSQPGDSCGNHLPSGNVSLSLSLSPGN